jgi:predicted adenine nucleotide alpha hydrolase (AANH) superfamily ATPase
VTVAKLTLIIVGSNGEAIIMQDYGCIYVWRRQKEMRKKKERKERRMGEKKVGEINK